MLAKRRVSVHNEVMEINEITAPVYSPRTCRRCKGTGQHSRYGDYTGCFSCNATGTEMVETGRRPLTSDEAAKAAEYQAAIAAREAREAARKARREARA